MTKKRFKWILLGSAIFLIVAACFAFFVPVPPHGRFTMPGIGNMADAYLEAADGKLTFVMWGGERGREGEEYRKFIGNYRKENGRWLLAVPSGGIGELRATLLSLTIFDDKTNIPSAGPYYRYELYKDH